MSISAKILADSISPQGIRLTTMQITLHRYVLAEFNTHRVFSRSFRSSRAVPVSKLLAEVLDNPALPVSWRANKRGMQGGEELAGEELARAKAAWLGAASDAARRAEQLMQIGVHKSWANRVIEPYLYVHGVVTATEWENFFALRRHPDAQPEMHALADAMWVVMQESEPTPLKPGEWHLPYVEDQWAFDFGAFIEGERQPNGLVRITDEQRNGFLAKISAARCARVSYRLHDGAEPDPEKDLALAERLLADRHMSPFEHVATPDTYAGDGFPDHPNWEWDNWHQHGNLSGWRQYRKMASRQEWHPWRSLA